MTTELYRLYRPTEWNEVVGQDQAVKVLKAKVKAEEVPHCILFSGLSGCGKTTLARILRTKIGCIDSEFNELNCADIRGIDNIRKIREVMMLAPMGGSCRVWLIDEAHKLTGDAQTALLKMLEDTPDHVYFMLATTNPGKVIKEIKTRAFPIQIKPLSENDLLRVLETVCEAATLEIAAPVLRRISEVADGSARQALVILDKIREVEPKDQMDAVEKSDIQKFAIDICRALANPSTTWPKMVEILKTVEQEPEEIRRSVLGYASSMLLGKNARSWPLAYLIIQCFRDHWIDCGKAGLVSSCYEVLTTRKKG